YLVSRGTGYLSNDSRPLGRIQSAIVWHSKGEPPSRTQQLFIMEHLYLYRRETFLVFSRQICLVLISLLLPQMGCAKTVATIRPETHRSLPLPRKVEVTLMSKTSLEVVHQGRETTWQTDRLSGRLVAWDDESVSIEVSGRPGETEIPIEYIKQIAIKETDFYEGCLIAGGVMRKVTLIIGAVMALIATVALLGTD
ncbi:hypothetical protein ACFL6S_01885, partial [Candidatus Poribacteria bacterium]